MKRFLCLLLVPLMLSATGRCARAAQRLNLLLITVDDMSADSIGVFGCQLADTTPHIDRLAAEGLRFTRSHVQVGHCMPSRNVMWSGRYPHNNGVEGFYQVKDVDYPVLVDLMKGAGYFTAIRHKVAHSTPYHPYGWDLVLDTLPDGTKAHVKDPVSYGVSTARGIRAAKAQGKPFCLMINIADPHKPFFAQGRRGETIPDAHTPSRVFTANEMPVPGFLFEDAVVRKELAHYYSSVRRADDGVGFILKALVDSGEADHTLVMFLSDHGMPLPFAKTQLYHHSTHTPLIFRWPGVTKPAAVDDQHMVSAVDFLPTLLDVVGATHPDGLDGRSFAPLLKGQPQAGREMVIKEYNENAGASRDPMRAVQTKRFLYLFNPWSNGQRVMATATTGTPTYRRMAELAATDKVIAARHELYQHRVVEELYDVQRDPDCLVNLIDAPEHRRELAELREALQKWMVDTGDHALAVFRKRDDAAAREAYVLQKEKEAQQRRRLRQQRPKQQKPRQQKPRQPNIVFLLIDDMGWPDVACYGHKFHQTPAIDRLARQGMKFTDFYAATPVCSSTRSTIQTGQYSARTAITDFIPGHYRPFEKLIVPPIEHQLRDGIITPGGALKAAGYATGYFGKWHLGPQPEKLGYDVTERQLGPAFRQSRDGRPRGPKSIDLLTDATLWFIEQNRDKPFFVTLSHHAVHIPVEATPETTAKYEAKHKPAEGVNHPVYAAMVEDLDTSIARILDKLDEFNLSQNTVVVFTSDNGGLRQIYTGVGEVVSTNAPLRDEKGTLYEGGIRVPMIVRWPGVVPPGSICPEPTTTADLLPTFCRLASVKPPKQPIDGRNMVPLLRNPESKLRRDAVYFHYPHYHHSRPAGAIRARDWKLVEFFEDGKLELYNLGDDLSETKNLAEARPQLAGQLQKQLAAWRDEVGARMPTKNPNYDPQRADLWWNRRANKPLDIEAMRKHYETRRTKQGG